MPRHPVLERTCKTADRPLTSCAGTQLSKVMDMVPEDNNVMPMLDDEEGGAEEVEIASEHGGQGEAEPLTTAPSPTMPSAAEVEEHRITHIPYRSWCRECVMGRGLGEKRGRHHQREHKIAIVGIDYFFITDRGVQKRDDMVDVYSLDSEGRRSFSMIARTAIW